MKVLDLFIKIWFFVPLLTSNTLFAEDKLSRLRPPNRIECTRDHLTNYTGKVVEYQRKMGQTRLFIATDWGTLEAVRLAHPGSADPSTWFLIEGKAFAQSDWERVEIAPGQLRKEVRATAWVCDDGRPPVIDWLAPRE
ncbi:MAG: hypothetical protein ACR65R_01830 [Methylomicrobium sp.]